MLDLMTATVRSTDVLVGREADLAVLRDALKRTRSAEPSAVLVGGEAGVGKTRLIEEFVRGAAADGAHVLTGNSLELGEEGLPYAPFVGALRELIQRDGTGVLQGREQDFVRLLPELGPPESGGDARRGHVFEAVATLFGRLADGQPLVLVLEDLHWSDRSTRDLIGFLLRAARLPHVLLIGTYRTDEMHRGHPLRPFLAELDRVRGVLRLELDRLDREGTAEMLGHLLGAEPEPGMVDTLNERAQGNPFFIEQIAASGDECGDISDNLRDLLLARVDQLSEPAQRVLRVAAVGGTRFGHGLLTRVAGVPEAELESALRAVVAAQLIVVDTSGEYEFRHALVREAVHDDLLPGEHARLHGRYAEVIEAEPGLVPIGRAPAEIAHHWHAANDHPRALVTARVAADDAGRRYAYGEQARLLDRVLQLWEQVPESKTLLGTCHVDLLEQAALVAIDAGETMRALSLTKHALAGIDCDSEPLRAARLLVRRSKLLQNAGKSDGAAESQEAYRVLQGQPHTAESVKILADVAQALHRADEDLAVDVAQEAMTAAADLGDIAAQVAATITYGRLCAGGISVEEALPVIRTAADTARRTGDQQNLAYALVNISDRLFETGRYLESADAAWEGVPYADKVGISRTTGVFLLANYAEAEIALGDWDEAERRLAEANRLDPPGTLALPVLRLRSWLRLVRGHEGAESLLTRAFGFLSKPYLGAEPRLYLLELRILCAFEFGDDAMIRMAAKAALAEPVITERPRYGWPVIAAAATAADRLNDPQLSELVELRARWTKVTYAVDRAYEAQVRATLSHDPQSWREAVAEWRADGQRFQLAVALLNLAEAVAGTGDRADAAAAIEEAAEIAGALGATPLLARTATLAQRLGLRPGAATQPGAEILTAREREVLRLVAEGQSNGRIAEQLYISPKTASVHVSRIIAKLNVANRVEAAAVARRLGLLDPKP
ncbi:helix-turn-helix transcriptional regulator [Actinoplanes sp. NBRC 103695]|uniref:helix-turn-helix transcriptional regulator n=1 Tax=Actinoplanes sp. NBRC 103695 TaxID=3032202 RepID=UPI0024A44EEE|nr:helix-turn-helix transcriptional regulator [Actinoplanes sp. NBRC 103695]GLY93292.1 helix-turn-helix transcriptional regulator [Actinoplanes sp. NBRC 103695]